MLTYLRSYFPEVNIVNATVCSLVESNNVEVTIRTYTDKPLVDAYIYLYGILRIIRLTNLS